MRCVQSKPVTLRQVAYEAVLAGESRSSSPELEEPTHVEEQQVLRDETIAAFHDAVADEDEDADDESDDGGGVLVPREKTKDELEREEEDYRAFLEKEVGSDLDDLITVEKAEIQVEKSSDVESDAKKKKKKKKRSKESKATSKEQEDHEFLMRYAFSFSSHAEIELLFKLHTQPWLDRQI
jgi:protein KRI1